MADERLKQIIGALKLGRRYANDAEIRKVIDTAIALARSMEKEQGARVFMCGVDFQHHLQDDAYGTKSWPDVETLKAHKQCWPECGIVEVEVRLVRWVEDQRIGEPPPSPLGGQG